MDRWKLWSVLLLTIPFYIDSEETEQLHKTIGSKPDVTPICSNETDKVISFIICKIRTERNAGEECVLAYQHLQGFKHECDSRFKLMKQNQTVFLHLTSLTPEDSGNYTCKCFRLDGVFILHLNITVEEDEYGSRSTKMAEIPLHIVLIGVFVSIMIIGVFLGVIYRKIHYRQLEVLASRPDTEPETIEPYIAFIQRENDLYSPAGFTQLHQY